MRPLSTLQLLLQACAFYAALSFRAPQGISCLFSFYLQVLTNELVVLPYETYRTYTSNKTYSTVKPMLRAVPSIVFIADARLDVLRSTIFNFAISSILLREIVPIFSLLGLPDPFAMPKAFLKRSAAGGVFVSNVNERSA